MFVSWLILCRFSNWLYVYLCIVCALEIFRYWFFRVHKYLDGKICINHRWSEIVEGSIIKSINSFHVRHIYSKISSEIHLTRKIRFRTWWLEMEQYRQHIAYWLNYTNQLRRIYISALYSKYLNDIISLLLSL